MLIGDRLRELREARNMSQGDIEKRTGLLRCYISRVENGHTVPAIETLEKLTRSLEIPLYQLFYDGEKPPELPNLPKRKTADDIAWGSSGKNALLDEPVFVGGCATALLITDKVAADVRPTLDVDAIAEITSYAEYADFSQRLRELEFQEDTSEGAPLCRWRKKTTILDVMPLDETDPESARIRIGSVVLLQLSAEQSRQSSQFRKRSYRMQTQHRSCCPSWI